MEPTPAAGPQPPTDALASKLKRTELQHKPSSIPGREIVQVLTEIPCGVESGWHIHPGEEVGYILAGTVHMMIQDQPTLILPAAHYVEIEGGPHVMCVSHAKEVNRELLAFLGRGAPASAPA